MTTPTTTNETAEQWANRFLRRVKATEPYDTVMPASLAELAATYRDAQAYRALPPLKPGERYIALAKLVEAEPFYIEE